MFAARRRCPGSAYTRSIPLSYSILPRQAGKVEKQQLHRKRADLTRMTYARTYARTDAIQVRAWRSALNTCARMLC